MDDNKIKRIAWQHGIHINTAKAMIAAGRMDEDGNWVGPEPVPAAEVELEVSVENAGDAIDLEVSFPGSDDGDDEDAVSDDEDAAGDEEE